jgi:WD40 repeat protein
MAAYCLLSIFITSHFTSYDGPILTCPLSYYFLKEEFGYLASGSRDRSVRLWDALKVRAPLRSDIRMDDIHSQCHVVFTNPISFFKLIFLSSMAAAAHRGSV